MKVIDEVGGIILAILKEGKSPEKKISSIYCQLGVRVAKMEVTLPPGILIDIIKARMVGLCPACKGWGFDPESKKKCLVCEGKGYLPAVEAEKSIAQYNKKNK